MTEGRNSNRMQLAFLGAITLVVLLVVVIAVAKSRTTAGKIIVNGDKAPDFRLSALDGRMFSLSDFKGKAVIVHFWATWCPPCVEEMPTLTNFHKLMQTQDAVLLAVSVDEGGANAVGGFLHRNKLSIPVLLDPDRSIAGSYGTFKFPETYFIDRKGIVRHKVIGPLDWSTPQAKQMLSKVLE